MSIGKKLTPATLMICQGPLPDARRVLDVIEFDPAVAVSRDRLLRALSDPGEQGRSVVLLGPSVEWEATIREMVFEVPRMDAALKMADIRDRLVLPTVESEKPYRQQGRRAARGKR